MSRNKPHFHWKRYTWSASVIRSVFLADVVIGAPYEDDMQGAIYIYNGCKTGLWPHFSQRIPAATMATGLMSFGISFSRSEDMNNDDVNGEYFNSLKQKIYVV